jgi:hypothetical protein
MLGFQKEPVKSTWNIALVLAAIVLLMNAAQARAYITLTIVSVAPVECGFQYTYEVTLTKDSALFSTGGGPNNGFSPSNNFVTLYDVQGLVPGSVTLGGALGAVGNATDAEEVCGDDPPGVAPIPPDDPTVPNITIYWTGEPVAAFGWMDVDLGTFTFVSTNPPGTGRLAYAAATQLMNSFPDVPANNFSMVAGPCVLPP